MDYRDIYLYQGDLLVFRNICHVLRCPGTLCHVDKQRMAAGQRKLYAEDAFYHVPRAFDADAVCHIRGSPDRAAAGVRLYRVARNDYRFCFCIGNNAFQDQFHSRLHLRGTLGLLKISGSILFMDALKKLRYRNFLKKGFGIIVELRRTRK